MKTKKDTHTLACPEPMRDLVGHCWNTPLSPPPLTPFIAVAKELAPSLLYWESGVWFKALRDNVFIFALHNMFVSRAYAYLASLSSQKKYILSL